MLWNAFLTSKNIVIRGGHSVITVRFFRYKKNSVSGKSLQNFPKNILIPNVISRTKSVRYFGLYCTSMYVMWQFLNFTTKFRAKQFRAQWSTTFEFFRTSATNARSDWWRVLDLTGWRRAGNQPEFKDDALMHTHWLGFLALEVYRSSLLHRQVVLCPWLRRRRHATPPSSSPVALI